jgi:hypothetical protein
MVALASRGKSDTTHAAPWALLQLRNSVHPNIACQLACLHAILQHAACAAAGVLLEGMLLDCQDAGWCICSA